MICLSLVTISRMRTGDCGICADSWLLCCDKYCHFIYVTTLRLHYEATEVRRVYVLFSAKYILFTWHFTISQSMNAPDWGKDKIIPACFYSPRMWESGGRKKKRTKQEKIILQVCTCQTWNTAGNLWVKDVSQSIHFHRQYLCSENLWNTTTDIRICCAAHTFLYQQSGGRE